jgi:CheY-like chemotaxis protein
MVIQGYAQILRGYCSKDHVAADDLNQIEHACERATHLTRQLLAFSRKRVSRPQVFDLNEVLESSDRMLRRLIGEDILVSLELTPGPCPVEADPIQFEQVVMNLAVNARDAMPGGGTLRLRTARVDANVVPSAKTAGDHVLLEVSDTGQGMDQRILPQIFEPFFTTKETGQGTGLGLSTVYAIVDQAGGVITVESLEGRGSVFSVWLPLSKRSIQKPPATGDTLPTSRGGETVLLVEDEPAVASLIEGILREAGYSTLVASDGQKALDLAAAHPGPIQLLFSDVVLPHLSGPELAERLCRQRPEIRVLLISGYAERELLGEAAQSLLLVEKPASPQTILRAVRRVLDDPDPQRLRSTDPSG